MTTSVVHPPTKVPTGQVGKSFALNFTQLADESLADFCRRVAWRLRECDAAVLHLLGFGKNAAAAACMNELRSHIGELNFPLTWVEGSPCNAQPVAGFQIYAFTGQVERVQLDERVVGSVFIEDGARQCLVGGLMPANTTLSPAEQTCQALDQLQTALAGAGLGLGDVIRTWFFLENILSWYDDFNRARTKIYSGVKFRTGSLPASTGVGAKNLTGSALALAAWAFKPLEKSANAKEIASPFQCPAPAYGSSFSRAMEISSDQSRRLFISGTASIAPGGKTLWTGNVRRQIELSMDVVEAILRSRGFQYADLSCATAYFRQAPDVKYFAQWLKDNRLEAMPVVLAQCDVCRDDLLFELECEATGQAD